MRPLHRRVEDGNIVGLTKLESAVLARLIEEWDNRPEGAEDIKVSWRELAKRLGQRGSLDYQKGKLAERGYISLIGARANQRVVVHPPESYPPLVGRGLG